MRALPDAPGRPTVRAIPACRRRELDRQRLGCINLRSPAVGSLTGRGVELNAPGRRQPRAAGQGSTARLAEAGARPWGAAAGSHETAPRAIRTRGGAAHLSSAPGAGGFKSGVRARWPHVTRSSADVRPATPLFGQTGYGLATKCSHRTGRDPTPRATAVLFRTSGRTRIAAVPPTPPARRKSQATAVLPHRLPNGDYGSAPSRKDRRSRGLF